MRGLIAALVCLFLGSCSSVDLEYVSDMDMEDVAELTEETRDRSSLAPESNLASSPQRRTENLASSSVLGDEEEGILETAAEECFVFGSWNLEAFNRGGRGFPETTKGGPSYGPRTSSQVRRIASHIRDELQAKFLILNEINYRSIGQLRRELGTTWRYVIATTGERMRIAFIYDTRFVRLNQKAELLFPEEIENGKDIFDRDPLMAHVTLLSAQGPANDLSIVGLHLASGQMHTENHDTAMLKLMERLDQLRGTTVLPSSENDILIGGDLNASWYDNDDPEFYEKFFDIYQANGWRVMAGQRYPGTRLADVPLRPQSQIDYLIATRGDGARRGLLGDEISSRYAFVNQKGTRRNWDEYRRVFSDHFPVTTCIKVGPDRD